LLNSKYKMMLKSNCLFAHDFNSDQFIVFDPLKVTY